MQQRAHMQTLLQSCR